MKVYNKGMAQVRSVSGGADYVTIKLRQHSNTPPCPVELAGKGAKYVEPVDEYAGETVLSKCDEFDGADMRPLGESRVCEAQTTRREWTCSHYVEGDPHATSYTYDVTIKAHADAFDYVRTASRDWLLTALLSAKAVPVIIYADPVQVGLDFGAMLSTKDADGNATWSGHLKSAKITDGVAGMTVEHVDASGKVTRSVVDVNNQADLDAMTDGIAAKMDQL